MKLEKVAWKSLKNVTTNFFWEGGGGKMNHTTEHCRDMVADFVQSYKAVGCDMSVSVHSLHSHLGVFP